MINMKKGSTHLFDFHRGLLKSHLLILLPCARRQRLADVCINHLSDFRYLDIFILAS